MPAWYDDDAAWARFEPVIFPPERAAAAFREVEEATTLLGLAAASDVLDLCCGIGRHAIELARCGHRVVGIDRTALYLARAREAAAAAAVAVEFVQAQMSEFVRERSFDAVVSLYTSFGYHPELEQDLETLRNLRRSLRDGGRFLLQLHGKEWVAMHFTARTWWEIGEDRYVIEERRIVENWSKSENRWLLFDRDGRHEFRFTLRLYAASELASHLRSAGFSSVRIFGGLDGRPYDRDARHLVALATA